MSHNHMSLDGEDRLEFLVPPKTTIANQLAATGRKYLAKERTPQAGYRRSHMFGGRLAGSHRLPGGGDRVRLSRELERDSIEASYVEPWRRTNARRSLERKPYRLRGYSSPAEGKAPSGGR